MDKHIISFGGGFTLEHNNPLFDLYVLASSQKKNPKICFLPTASGDNANYIDHFESVFSEYPCRPFALRTISPDRPDMEDAILDSDIIYVGGGNTKSMIAIWREWGVDKLLKRAYDQGTILAGVSAGLVCWFEECITDSIPNKFTALTCLGILPGSACPHYDGQAGRPAAYHKLIKNGVIGDGYAVDDGAGIHFVNGKLLRAIASIPNSNAYYVYRDMSGKVLEDPIKPEYLGNIDNFTKYIATSLGLEDTVKELEDESEDAGNSSLTDNEITFLPSEDLEDIVEEITV